MRRWNERRPHGGPGPTWEALPAAVERCWGEGRRCKENGAFEYGCWARFEMEDFLREELAWRAEVPGELLRGYDKKRDRAHLGRS
ncbi:hypothetical protein MTO96_009810 [Rhipicephalus appendiculatus]